MREPSILWPCQAYYLDACAQMTYSESIAIQPTSGGVAPLYSPRTPSFRIVCSTQSSGPRKCVVSEVCRRTLIVSKLRDLISV